MPLSASVGARQLTRLGRYLNRVRGGERIILTDRSEPIAELRPIDAGRTPVDATLARLAAAGGLTLPTRRGLARVSPIRLTGGSGSGAVAADRDERG